MGDDFLRKVAKPYRKSLDRRRAELATPHLFTPQPESAPRAFAAKLQEGQRVAPGEKLSICMDGDQITALRGLDPIATLMNPPIELRQALSASHGEASGQVREVHDIAGVAEIAVW